MATAVLTDIEGTTSSIRFVKEVLFPYAARHMEAFLSEHWDEAPVQEQLRAIEAEIGQALPDAATANQVLQEWIAQDRKATPLKTLQGLIWRAGYEQGDYKAHIYPDAAHQLRRWRERGLALYVYSSGSVAAQKLFFGYSEAGDLRPLFSGYFDTRTGHKRDSDSYRRIAELTNRPASDILFLSDVEGELDAARAAGMKTILVDRDGDAAPSSHERVRHFSAIEPRKL